MCLLRLVEGELGHARAPRRDAGGAKGLYTKYDSCYCLFSYD